MIRQAADMLRHNPDMIKQVGHGRWDMMKHVGQGRWA